MTGKALLDGRLFDARDDSAAPKVALVNDTLARAFFPDSGQHDLMMYPSLFEQPRHEQVETLANDQVFIFAGGELPTRFLSECGVVVETKFGEP